MKALLRITQRERYLLRALEIGLIIAVLICQAKALSIYGTRMEADIPAGESLNQTITILGSDHEQRILIRGTDNNISIAPHDFVVPANEDRTAEISVKSPCSGYIYVNTVIPGDRFDFGEEIGLTVCVGAPCPTPPTPNLNTVTQTRNTDAYYTGTPTYLPTPTETINNNAYNHTDIWFMMAAALVGAWIAAMITAFVMWRRKK